MSTDRYEEFRAKAINSKEMFIDLVNKNPSGFKMFEVSALGGESYISKLLVEQNCFDLPVDEYRDDVAKKYNSFFFNVTLLKDNGEIDYFSDGKPYTDELSPSSAGISGNIYNRHLCFLNESDANEYLEWEKNDPTRVQKRIEENKRMDDLLIEEPWDYPTWNE